jgi:DNA-binding transcriptional regulator YiaG
MTAADCRAVRERFGLTGLAMAELLGVHRQAFWLWEAGRRPVPEYIARLLILIEHLGVDKACRVLRAKRLP